MSQILWDFYAIILHNLIQIYIWIVIIGVIFSWLISFNVVNTRNPFVAWVARTTYQLTEPVMRPIRNFIPAFGGLDFTPILVILGLSFLDRVLGRFFWSLANGGV